MLDGTQAKYGDIMNDMNLMDELMKIPADATAATVQGIEMENIKSLDPLLYSHLTHQKYIRIK